MQPVEGVVLAIGSGTHYAIRVPDEQLRSALEAGCTSEKKLAGGCIRKIEDTLGAGWVFGAWLEEEKQWLARVYEECAAAT